MTIDTDKEEPVMMDLSKASVAILLDACRAQAHPSAPADDEAGEAPAAEEEYVTADVARYDRMAAQRLALVGFLYVGC